MHGDDLPDVVHVAALEDGSAVGACVLQPAGYPHRAEPGSWQLRGMATADGRRGRGVGALVIGGAVDVVTGRGGQFLWCKARAVAIAFYERNGFVVDTSEYVEPETGLPHRDMYLRLSAG